MTQAITLSELKQRPVPAVSNEIGFSSIAGFEALQRMANMFASSKMVPDDFRGKVGDAAIVLDMAIRMHANPLSIFQNLYLIHGRPSWSAQFLIATCNQCGRFSSIRYNFQGEEGKDDWGCRAVATELSTGKQLEGPLVTIGLAKREGWYGKSGSKWQSMPELMLRYRAASWFVRAFAPELAMGLPEKTELEDTVIDVTPEPVTTETIKEKTTRSRRKKADPEPVQEVEPVTEEPATQAEESEAAPAEEAPAKAKTWTECPDRDGMIIGAEYCHQKCTKRQGCPAWD